MARFINEPILPKIIFTPDAYFKMCAIAQSTTPNGREVMWLGDATKINEYDFLVSDIHIPPQTKNSAVYVETDDARFPEWIAPMKIDQRKKLRLHGHLHPNFSTTPSSTDEQLFNQLLGMVSDFYLRIIINKSYEFTLDVFDKQRNLIFNNCSLYIKVTDDFNFIITPKAVATVELLNGLTLQKLPHEIIDDDIVFSISENAKLKYGLLDKSALIELDNIYFENNKIQIYETSKEIDAELEKMIHKEVVTPIQTFKVSDNDDEDYNERLFNYQVSKAKETAYEQYQKNKQVTERAEQIKQEALNPTDFRQYIGGGRKI